MYRKITCLLTSHMRITRSILLKKFGFNYCAVLKMCVYLIFHDMIYSKVHDLLVQLSKFVSVLLQEFGHHVRLATHANFRTFVRSAGVDFFPLGGDPHVLAGCKRSLCGNSLDFYVIFIL